MKGFGFFRWCFYVFKQRSSFRLFRKDFNVILEVRNTIALAVVRTGLSPQSLLSMVFFVFIHFSWSRTLSQTTTQLYLDPCNICSAKSVAWTFLAKYFWVMSQLTNRISGNWIKWITTGGERNSRHLCDLVFPLI